MQHSEWGITITLYRGTIFLRIHSKNLVTLRDWTIRLRLHNGNRGHSRALQTGRWHSYCATVILQQKYDYFTRALDCRYHGRQVCRERRTRAFREWTRWWWLPIRQIPTHGSWWWIRMGDPVRVFHLQRARRRRVLHVRIVLPWVLETLWREQSKDSVGRFYPERHVPDNG